MRTDVTSSNLRSAPILRGKWKRRSNSGKCSTVPRASAVPFRNPVLSSTGTPPTSFSRQCGKRKKVSQSVSMNLSGRKQPSSCGNQIGFCIYSKRRCQGKSVWNFQTCKLLSTRLRLRLFIANITHNTTGGKNNENNACIRFAHAYGTALWKRNFPY